MVRTSRVSKQIYKKDGNNCFVEILNDRFFESKVHFVFQSYDKSQEQGERIKDKIDFFLTFEEALTFIHYAKSGAFYQALQNDRKKMLEYCKNEVSNGKKESEIKYYPAQPYKLLRGTKNEKLAVKRTDGNDESRCFTLSCGNVTVDRILHPNDAKYKNASKPNRFILQCDSGPGKTIPNPNGGFIISPLYKSYQPEKRIIIPFEDVNNYNFKDSLVEMATILESNIQGYIQSGYAYEYLNPEPSIISANAVNQQIHIGDVVDIVLFTPKNVTKIACYLGGKECLPNIEFQELFSQGKPTDTNVLEWHFKKTANKENKGIVFEFIPYVDYEKGTFPKKAYVKVSSKNKE